MEGAGATHHVIAKGNAGAAIVFDDHDRNAFVGRMGATILRHKWSCLAYCLMNTHVHLIVTTSTPSLGVGMRWLLGPYAQAFNFRHGREGGLFRGRFYSKPIESDGHLIAALVYVLLNPVRAGLVGRPELWQWGSYSASVGLEPAPDYLDVSRVLALMHPHDESASRRALELAVREARERELAAPPDLGT